MAVTRADTLTQSRKTKEVYSDFFNDFVKSPFSGDLALLKNERSVSQSIRNLIFTNFGERLFNPNFGSDVYKTLFENNFEENLHVLEYRIRQSIINFEPRVLHDEENLTIIVRSNQEMDFTLNRNLEGVSQEDILSGSVMPGDTEHLVEVTVVFKIINNITPTTITVILKRVR